MKQDSSASSTAIQQLRRQQKQMLKLILAFILVTIAGVAVPEYVKSILQDGLFLRILGILWGGVIGIVLLAILVAAVLAGKCPVCGGPLGEDFWWPRYCPNCGAKLSETA